ncbi:hypothetical protein LIER_00804 [Lithospermum erythrorhizon]|uniref:Uncharacterized protein n=1 Tax=Lithospermum erythrorhizon TaxID=34254 RepID=A0AAV3NIL0_LITER
MASRIATRYLRRNFSSSGKILSKEEQAAENVYIKKTEQEKLEKLARKGPNAEETKPGSGGSASVTEAKPTGESSSAKISTDKNRNYAVVAGIVTFIGGLGWYMMSRDKKTAEVQD